MPYTQSQLEAAEDRLSTAKENWQDSVSEWNEFVNLLCYTDTKHAAEAAATWFTPTDSSCTQSGSSCSHADKKNCQDVIADIRATVIPTLRANYTELQAAQASYDTISKDVEPIDPGGTGTGGTGTDGDNGNGVKKKSYMWLIIIGIIVLLVIGGLIWYFRFRK